MIDESLDNISETNEFHKRLKGLEGHGIARSAIVDTQRCLEGELCIDGKEKAGVRLDTLQISMAGNGSELP